MSNRAWIFVAVMAGVGFTTRADATPWSGDVSVEIIDARGERFEQFPARHGGSEYRAYVRAERGAPYRIRVRNGAGERVGVVVTVDGRNIISGARSDLQRDEPMYVLAPGETEEYTGWRTNLSDVHEFYFTDWKDSYAEAFGDRSARGVIAIAVYHEQERVPVAPSPPTTDSNASAARAPESAGTLERKDTQSRRAEPGTGFGDRRYEPATRVAFEAEQQPRSRVFLKYEWPETLCQKHIAQCGSEDNRFWSDELAFAPYPPGRAR